MAAIEFVKKDTPIHRLQPLTKLILLIASLVVMVAVDDLFLYVAWILMLLVWWKVGKIELGRFAGLARLLTGTFLFLVVIQGFMPPSSPEWKARLHTVLFSVGPYPFWLEGGLFGLTLVIRVLCVVAAIPIFTMTSPLAKIAATFARLRIPFTYSYVFLSALRFVPFVSWTWEMIRDAQKLRGFDMSRLPLLDRLRRGYVPLIIPLFISLFRTSDSLEIALSSRAFGAPVKRTYVESVGLGANDVLAIGVILVMLIGFIWLRFTYGSIFWPFVASAEHGLWRF